MPKKLWQLQQYPIGFRFQIVSFFFLIVSLFDAVGQYIAHFVDKTLNSYQHLSLIFLFLLVKEAFVI